MLYQPTAASVSQHPLPAWFDDAKFGIFIHWGLYSVPAWAPATGEVTRIVEEEGWKSWFANNAYAEWYLNTLKIEGSPTARHHAKVYGEMPYQGFVPLFNQALQRWDPALMASQLQVAGARYVVLVSKHHDGFTLWPSQQANPLYSQYHAERDIVGELSQAVRREGLTMGLYYSGGLDWTFRHPVITDVADLMTCIPQNAEYIAYAAAHIRELITRYQPAVLWGDIGYPTDADVAAILADYYNAVPEGVVNDRFVQHEVNPRDMRFWGSKPGRWLLRRLFGRQRRQRPTHKPILPHVVQYDFTTPEYATHAQIMPYKWEATRGLGFSFGYNQMEGPEKTLSVTELVHFLADVVSKNGNLLLNIGPMADGTIPPIQLERLKGLGRWLAINGDAIYATRPWEVAEGVAEGGVQVRYTARGETVYAIMLGERSGPTLLTDLNLIEGSVVKLLGHTEPLAWANTESGVRIELPAQSPNTPAMALSISPRPRLAHYARS